MFQVIWKPNQMLKTSALSNSVFRKIFKNILKMGVFEKKKTNTLQNTVNCAVVMCKHTRRHRSIHYRTTRVQTLLPPGCEKFNSSLYTQTQPLWSSIKELNQIFVFAMKKWPKKFLNLKNILLASGQYHIKLFTANRICFFLAASSSLVYTLTEAVQHKQPFSILCNFKHIHLTTFMQSLKFTFD